MTDVDLKADEEVVTSANNIAVSLKNPYTGSRETKQNINKRKKHLYYYEGKPHIWISQRKNGECEAWKGTSLY